MAWKLMRVMACDGFKMPLNEVVALKFGKYGVWNALVS
jgi:hypothetical protein